MRDDVRRGWDWSNRFGLQIEAILRSLAHHIVSFRWATEEEDYHQATDFVIEVEGSAMVAGRLRRESSVNCRRDLSLRHSRDGRVKERSANGNGPAPQEGIEEAKILGGWARWYLYGWTEGDRINEWVFVSLDEVRRTWPILRARSELIPNRDGRTAGRYISIDVLAANECVVHHYGPQRSLWE